MTISSVWNSNSGLAEALLIGMLTFCIIDTVSAGGCAEIDEITGTPGGEQAETVESGLSGTMIRIPAGNFCMGDMSGNGEPDEQPVHAVQPGAFWLGRHEVTRRQFRAFIEATGYLSDAEREHVAQPGCLAVDPGEWSFRYRPAYSWKNPGFEQADRHPVVCVSYNDALAFISWLNRQTGLAFRLPTEVEWEYAVRGGSRTVYPWGNTDTDSCQYANVADRNAWPGHVKSPFGRIDCNDGYPFTAPVGSYVMNSFGIYDLSGNAWEWVADCWAREYGFAADHEVCGFRVFRGSSWMNSARSVRSANRSKNGPSDRLNTVGFRLALDQDARPAGLQSP